MRDPAFSTAYASEKAFVLIWIPLISAAILGLAGLYMNEFLLTVLSALLTGMAVYNWPLADPARVVLRLTGQGVDIDGIGHVPWDMVRAAGPYRSGMETQRPVAVLIDLKLPIAECVHTTAVMERPNWQRKLGRISTDKRIAVPIQGLFDPPGDIIDAFESFLGDRFKPNLS